MRAPGRSSSVPLAPSRIIGPAFSRRASSRWIDAIGESFAWITRTHRHRGKVPCQLRADDVQTRNGIRGLGIPRPPDRGAPRRRGERRAGGRAPPRPRILSTGGAGGTAGMAGTTATAGTTGSGRDGRIKLVRADVWDEPTVARAVKGSASVINTVGHYVEKRGATFDSIHGQGARHVARQAKEAGAERLIHISGLGADPGSDSPYVRARGIGEGLVREAFDGVTILRPSVIFGPGDSFLNKLAAMARQTPVLPLFGTGGTRLQPVFVGNVAEACARVLAEPSTKGRVYELGGPRVYAYEEIVRLVLERDRRANGPRPGPLPRVGPPGRRDGNAAQPAAHPRPGEAHEARQRRRGTGVDPGRSRHSPRPAGRGPARLHCIGVTPSYGSRP